LPNDKRNQDKKVPAQRAQAIVIMAVVTTVVVTIIITVVMGNKEEMVNGQMDRIRMVSNLREPNAKLSQVQVKKTVVRNIIIMAAVTTAVDIIVITVVMDKEVNSSGLMDRMLSHKEPRDKLNQDSKAPAAKMEVQVTDTMVVDTMVVDIIVITVVMVKEETRNGSKVSKCKANKPKANNRHSFGA